MLGRRYYACALGRVVGAGRVEQRSSGGCWAQSVCNRGGPATEASERGEGVILGCLRVSLLVAGGPEVKNVHFRLTTGCTTLDSGSERRESK